MRSHLLLIVCLITVAVPLAMFSNVDKSPTPNKLERKLVPVNYAM